VTVGQIVAMANMGPFIIVGFLGYPRSKP